MEIKHIKDYMVIDEVFRKKLFELCLKYDIINGSYPESEFEGKNIYREYVEDFSDWNEKLEEYNEELRRRIEKGR